VGSQGQYGELHYKDYIPKPDAAPALRNMVEDPLDDGWWEEGMDEDAHKVLARRRVGEPSVSFDTQDGIWMHVGILISRSEKQKRRPLHRREKPKRAVRARPLQRLGS